HGFLFEGGTYTPIDFPGSNRTEPLGINSSGQVVGDYFGDGRLRGFLLSGGTFLTFDVFGSTQTTGFGVNDLGQVVGRYSAGASVHGFLLSDGEFTTLDFPGAAGFSSAEGINAAGQVVGVYQDAGGRFHGFLATPVPQPGTAALVG